MKLMTKELEKEFKKIGSQENNPDPVVIAKYFNPCGSQTWYATEYFPESRTCFGYVTGMDCDEWGYFSLDEMESVKVPPLNLLLERDLYFVQQPISKLVPALTKSNESIHLESEMPDNHTYLNNIRKEKLENLQSQKDKSINNLER